MLYFVFRRLKMSLSSAWPTPGMQGHFWYLSKGPECLWGFFQFSSLPSVCWQLLLLHLQTSFNRLCASVTSSLSPNERHTLTHTVATPVGPLSAFPLPSSTAGCMGSLSSSGLPSPHILPTRTPALYVCASHGGDLSATCSMGGPDCSALS